MTPRRFPSWLPFVGVLVPVALGLGWLLLFFAGDRTGMVPLPDVVAGSTVEFFKDPGGQLTRAEVAAQPAPAWAQWSGQGHISARRVPLWLRVTLRNPAAEPQRGVLVDSDRFADRVELWTEEGGAWHAVVSGEAVPARARILGGRDIAFPLSVPARGQFVAYLRVDDFLFANVRLAWWPEVTAYLLSRERGLLAEGIYFGALLGLLGYNLLLWVRLRLADIGYYVLYLVVVVGFMFVARAHVATLGGRLGSPATETVLAVTLGLAGFFLTQFARVFLDLSAGAGRANRVARGLGRLMLMVAVGGLSTRWFPAWMVAAVMGTAVTHVTLFVLAVRAWRAGVWQARFFVLAFACFVAGSVVNVASWGSYAHTQETSMMGLMIGSTLEMLLLSLAVAERFARAQREKTLAQARLMEETEQRRMIEATYSDELETEVRERTQELSQANADQDRMLAVIGHDLRSPLTGLMRSADRATGDFAREAALTGRTLLLMIEDVVVWARLRAGSRAAVAHPASGLVVPAVALHRALAEHDGMKLILEVPENLTVETDLVLAQTLVRNLLANALKFARTRVVLRAVADGQGGVRFTVGNDGPALSAAVAARLTAGENEPMTATGGLGLRLCREICSTLGHRLEAGTGADGGTEFSFTLRQAPGPVGGKS